MLFNFSYNNFKTKRKRNYERERNIEFILLNNYVELEQEEMMYLNVGLRSQLGRFCGGIEICYETLR